MTTLLEKVNTTREKTISFHYMAASVELQEKIKDEPLKNKFDICSGCISEDVTRELAHRFNIGGIKATPTKGWLSWYLVVETTLPVDLVHDKSTDESS